MIGKNWDFIGILKQNCANVDSGLNDITRPQYPTRPCSRHSNGVSTKALVHGLGFLLFSSEKSENRRGFSCDAASLIPLSRLSISALYEHGRRQFLAIHDLRVGTGSKKIFNHVVIVEDYGLKQRGPAIEVCINFTRSS